MFSISRNCAQGLQKKDYSILWSILESPEPEMTSPILENQKAKNWAKNGKLHGHYYILKGVGLMEIQMQSKKEKLRLGLNPKP